MASEANKRAHKKEVIEATQVQYHIAKVVRAPSRWYFVANVVGGYFGIIVLFFHFFFIDNVRLSMTQFLDWHYLEVSEKPIFACWCIIRLIFVGHPIFKY